METDPPKQRQYQELWFKSYYVVWKLRHSNIHVFLHFRFKSYYVVWKQEEYHQMENEMICLNRTM